jgi:23S rRNA-/tRNA-specific pseudouridylate synthase
MIIKSYQVSSCRRIKQLETSAATIASTTTFGRSSILSLSKYPHIVRWCYHSWRRPRSIPNSFSMVATSPEASPVTVPNSNTKFTTKNPVVPLEPDHPCWGSPTNCSLADLLRWISKENDSIIRHDSKQYLVLNKPPDLRMDGPYPATVHKLLTYWYPSPSLMEKCSDNHNNKKNHSIGRPHAYDHDNNTVDDNNAKNGDDRFQARLLEVVSQLHQYNDVHDNILRHCHQLDYATSGILLVAKTRAAAFHVARLLEDRKVTKTYIAIVVGHLMTSKTTTDGDTTSTTTNGHASLPIDKFPVWTPISKMGATNVTNEMMLRLHLQQLEKRYRKSRSNANKQHNNKQAARATNHKTKSTFPGYQPVHSIFQKWKARMAKQDDDYEHDANGGPANKKPRKQKTTLLSQCDWERIWGPVDRYLAQKKKNREGHLGESWYQDLQWKKLGNHDDEFKQAMMKATDLHNDILRNAMRENETANYGPDQLVDDLPTLFCLQSNKSTVSDQGLDTFFVFCPLADDPDRFSMVVPSNIVNDCPYLPAATHPHNKDKDETPYDFKPSMTKCTVIEQGSWTSPVGTNIPITKVKLFPITGRRHQLRVHMAIAGHPILGDLTYGLTASTGEEELSATPTTTAVISETTAYHNRRSNSGACPRMCLHAHTLALPSLLGETEGEWKVDAPDPFPIVNGNLITPTNPGI